jgi:hypothetical protein
MRKRRYVIEHFNSPEIGLPGESVEIHGLTVYHLV